MTDYLIKISKTSIKFNKKDIYIPKSILDYYYHFNELSENCNIQMKMHNYEKPLTLLGKFKINFENNNIIFENDLIKIKVIGSFIFRDNTFYYYKTKKISHIIHVKK